MVLGIWHLHLAVGILGGALELRLINMDERIAVGTRYFVVDPAWRAAAPSPRIPTGYYPAICSDEPIDVQSMLRLRLTNPSWC